MDSLKTELDAADGVERVDLLNKISKVYEHQIPDSSFYYALEANKLAIELEYISGQALSEMYKGNYFTNTNRYEKASEAFNFCLDLYKSIDDKVGILQTYNNLGNMLRTIGEYDQALYNFIESMKMSEEVGNKKGIAYASVNIGLIYATRLGESEDLGLPYFLKGLEICREIEDMHCVAYTINNIALVYAALEEYDKALEYHFQSLDLKEAHNDQYGIATSLSNISDIYLLKKEYDKALDYDKRALTIYNGIDDLRGAVSITLDIGRIYFLRNQFNEAAPYMNEALAKIDEVNSLQVKSACYQYHYEFHLAQKDYPKALDFYQKYTMVKDSMYTENSSQQIAEMQTLYETEKKEAEIDQLTNEKTIQELKLKKSENMQWFFTVVTLLTLLVASFAYYGYRHKMATNKLLRERNKYEIENKKRAISLFGQQVSKEVALELLSDSFKSGSKKLFACIMFLDIRDFTPFAENKEPSEIIKYQNDVFGFMIDIISKHHGIINQFLGDGFMATFGAPASSGNDCQHAVDASLEIIELLNQKCESCEIPQTRVGIGLHAGAIVTGNVGTAERKQYSITGNTVILASRIEQLNKKYASDVLISGEVFEKLETQDIKVQSMGLIELKGRAEPMEIIRLV